MNDPIMGRESILITGGTSGLGLELVKIFLNKGFRVVATGRQPVSISGYEDNFKFYQADFSNLKQTANVFRQICQTCDFDLVINNAGILSPPVYTLTTDGHEYTYQVNFLAHLLVNEIIISMNDNSEPLKIAAVTSPVYRIATHDLKSIRNSSDYSPLKAYSDSKLFLSLMCRYLFVKYHDRNILCFSFDPGVFASRIYRMQSGVFRTLYHVASPFMRKPSAVARKLAEILTGSNITSGAVYNIKNRSGKLPETELSVSESFWKETYREIASCLSL